MLLLVMVIGGCDDLEGNFEVGSWSRAVVSSDWCAWLIAVPVRVESLDRLSANPGRKRAGRLMGCGARWNARRSPND